MFKKSRALIVMVLASCLLLAAGWASAAQTIRELQVSTDLSRTNLVIGLSGPVKYTTSTLANPNRLVIDIHDSRLAADVNKLPLRDSPIKRVRSGVRNGTHTRLVLDLDETVTYRANLLKKGQGLGDRLVIDLYRGGARNVAAASAPAAAPRAVAAAASTNAAPAPVRNGPVKSASDNSARRDIIIAIDAGHGGQDPGAIGPGRVQEKHVAMAIAKELAALFERQRGYKSVLIRKGDYFLPLKSRRDLARKHEADLMVSIHADAFHDPRVSGGSVFALSNSGATSTMAAFLATSENQADAIGGVRVEGKNDDLVKVLTDLSLSATMGASMKVGNHVLSSLGNVASLHTRRVEQAAFVVLKSPDTPSILVETGFISNPREAKLLATRAYQQKMARAIFDGVNRHFNQTPPPGTYIAWAKRNGNQRQVGQQGAAVRGETVASNP